MQRRGYRHPAIAGYSEGKCCYSRVFACGLCRRQVTLCSAVVAAIREIFVLFQRSFFNECWGMILLKLLGCPTRLSPRDADLIQCKRCKQSFMSGTEICYAKMDIGTGVSHLQTRASDEKYRGIRIALHCTINDLKSCPIVKLLPSLVEARRSNPHGRLPLALDRIANYNRSAPIFTSHNRKWRM